MNKETLTGLHCVTALLHVVAPLCIVAADKVHKVLPVNQNQRKGSEDLNSNCQCLPMQRVYGKTIKKVTLTESTSLAW